MEVRICINQVSDRIEDANKIIGRVQFFRKIQGRQGKSEKVSPYLNQVIKESARNFSV